MTEDLRAVEMWVGGLLARLQPAQRRALNREVAQDLRRSQAQRVASQHAPDGAMYTARKKRKDLRGKKGRIKRQKAAMFEKLRVTKNLKTQQDENQISVGFFGRVARIARVHQDGLKDKVSKKRAGISISGPAFAWFQCNGSGLDPGFTAASFEHVLMPSECAIKI